MASLFKRGDEKRTTTSGPSPAGEELMRLLMQTLAARYSENQGKPQTFADWLKQGPRGMPAGLDMAKLLNASGQPGAFNQTATQTNSPSSASPFEQGVSVLSALASLGLAGSQLYNQYNKPAGPNIPPEVMQNAMLMTMMGMDAKPFLAPYLQGAGSTPGGAAPGGSFNYPVNPSEGTYSPDAGAPADSNWLSSLMSFFS